MAIAEKNWFASWFDTPYYHILYKDRGYSEAGVFMENLVSFLGLPKGSSILDLACGRGRHSIFLNKLGFDVTGVDLSPNSISYAKKFEQEDLHFEAHDMSRPMDRTFDTVFNLFTSFGYFDRDEDNYRTVTSIKKTLNENGYGVIDFMNARKVIANLVPEDTKTVEGIKFHLQRYYEDGYIFKNIRFEDGGEGYHFQERVKALHFEDFRRYFSNAGLRIKNVFGNYQLGAYNEDTSDRLILVFQ